jgi:OOP family OmpA-OmpF porin
MVQSVIEHFTKHYTRRIKNLLILLFTLLTSNLFSQNLVPNPSFEGYTQLPTSYSQGASCISTWRVPNTEGRAEYYHASSSSKKAGVPKNHFGSQEAHIGDAYMGLCIAKNIREFLQVGLTQPLVKGKEYQLSIHISCADKFWLGSVDEFAILFTKAPFVFPGIEKLLTPPSIIFTGDFSNKKEWIELTTTYVAEGTERYLPFGCFTYVEGGAEHGKIKGIANYAHFYVDDVSVELIEEEETILEEGALPEVKLDYVTEEKYIYENLLFESGSATLIPNEYSELEELILYLAAQKEYRLVITGHTDNQGSSELNHKLSLERANALKQFLVIKGIQEEVITVEGKGDKVPLASNDTEEGRKKNRRVQVTILH